MCTYIVSRISGYHVFFSSSFDDIVERSSGNIGGILFVSTENFVLVRTLYNMERKELLQSGSVEYDLHIREGILDSFEAL